MLPFWEALGRLIARLHNMARSTIIVSGFTFAVLTLISYPLFGWRIDGWIMTSYGFLHLAIVLRYYPRLDAFSVGFHYLVALVAVTGIVQVLLDITGPTPWPGRILLALLRDRWSTFPSYFLLGGYIILLATIFFLGVVLLSWIINRRSPLRQELLAGFFVASILNIPCDFALADAVSHIAVQDPEQAQAFVFAVGIESLDLPLILHGIVVMIATTFHVAARIRSTDCLFSMKEPR